MSFKSAAREFYQRRGVADVLVDEKDFVEFKTYNPSKARLFIKEREKRGWYLSRRWMAVHPYTGQVLHGIWMRISPKRKVKSNAPQNHQVVKVKRGQGSEASRANDAHPVRSGKGAKGTSHPAAGQGTDGGSRPSRIVRVKPRRNRD